MGSGYIDPHFLAVALVGGEWSTSRPGRFTPEEVAPRTHWIGGWMDLRAGLDDLEKRKFLRNKRILFRILRQIRIQILFIRKMFSETIHRSNISQRFIITKFSP
jgi:hypothetical protein